MDKGDVPIIATIEVLKEESKTGPYGSYTKTSIKISPPDRLGEWLSANVSAEKMGVYKGGTYTFIVSPKPRDPADPTKGCWLNIKDAIPSPTTAPVKPPVAEVREPIDEPMADLPGETPEEAIERDYGGASPRPAPKTHSVDGERHIIRQAVMKSLLESGADNIVKIFPFAGIQVTPAMAREDAFILLVERLADICARGTWKQ